MTWASPTKYDSRDHCSNQVVSGAIEGSVTENSKSSLLTSGSMHESVDKLMICEQLKHVIYVIHLTFLGLARKSRTCISFGFLSTTPPLFPFDNAVVRASLLLI